MYNNSYGGQHVHWWNSTIIPSHVHFQTIIMIASPPRQTSTMSNHNSHLHWALPGVLNKAQLLFEQEDIIQDISPCDLTRAVPATDLGQTLQKKDTRPFSGTCPPYMLPNVTSPQVTAGLLSLLTCIHMYWRSRNEANLITAMGLKFEFGSYLSPN